MAQALYAAFFLSGAAALIFETLWFRQAGLAFGNSVWASSLVLSSFMAGLALGNGLAARLGARIRRPVRVYAGLEGAIALTGVGLVWLLPGLAGWLAPLWRFALDLPWALNPLRLLLAFSLLLAPATAMGATLPLLVKALRARHPSFGWALGNLYGWNTLGAVLGVLAGEGVLVGAFGIQGAAWVAGGLNVAAALIALALERQLGRARAEATPADAPAAPGSGSAGRLLAAAFLAGGILLALEVVWFRFLELFVYSAGLSFALMLAVVLSGIALGGFSMGAWLRRRPDAVRGVAVVAFLSGVAVVVTYSFFSFSIAPFGSETISRPPDVLRISAALMLPVSLLSGMLFTLTGAAVRQRMASDTGAAGLLTLANTVGAGVGALAAGFLLIPQLGVERSVFLLACLYAVAAILLLQGRSRPAAAPGAWLLPVSAALLALALLRFPFGAMENRYLEIAARRFGYPHRARIAAMREGRTETVVYLSTELSGEPLFYRLVTDGFGMATNRVWARRYMKLFVYWPVALRPDPERALLISYGIGSTAKALTDTRSLKRIDVVDISSDILEMSELVYPDPEAHPLRDPRLNVYVDDGRHFLLTRPLRYDLITAEPPPPRHAGAVNLYTREYFELVYARLAEGGINTHWLPAHKLAPAETKAILRGYCQVFEDCSLWTTAGLNWMMVGSRSGRWSRSEPDFERQWRDPRVAPELSALGVEKPEQLGAMFMADAAQLRELIGDAPPLVDDFPKRLCDRPPHARELAAHAAWMHTDETRQRFRDSELVRRAWPPALRERTLAYFAHQKRVNDTRAALTPRPIDVPGRIGALHEVLTGSELRTLALWELGIEHNRLAAVDRLLASGASETSHLTSLAGRALAARDFATAARYYERARFQSPRNANSLYLHVYALCMAGQVEEAEELAHRQQGWLPRGDGPQRYWAWLSDTFDFEAPDLD